jgi:mannose-6-phosphate isomerase-like protein (cupin superfamily)
MAKNTSRRNFLRTAPVAAAASFALTDALLLAAQTPVASSDSAAAPFQLFTAQQLADDTKALAAKGGNNNLVDVKPNLPFSMVLTTEIAKSAPNFEQHAERDHIFIILDGSTVYEIGGTLKNAHTTKPGEQLAPDAVGTTKVTLNKGDILTVPRGTPHRRTTAGSVTLILISPSGTMKA